ncbi:MAG: peptidoglycan-binding protein LysM [Rhodospirillales bacterium]|nr:peptidoglycan-binding protein LysM [Rhodospirillales bacterium]
MSIWDFVKSAGALLGIGGGDQAPKAEDLKSSIEKLGLPVDGIDIKVNGDTVVVSGKAPSEEVKEKVVLALGNVTGIAKVEEHIETPPGESSDFYTVKSGDTLSAIAKVHYGNAGKYMVIFEANKPMLSNPDKIYPGQVLRIPKSA